MEKKQDLYEELESERLILRKIKEDDAVRLYNNIYNNYEYYKYYYQLPFESFENYKLLVEKYKEYYENGNHFRWGIVIKETNEIIGLVQLHSRDYLNNNCQIGYIIGYNYNNFGYAKEAVVSVINFAFEKLNIHRVDANITEENKASIKLAESIGMTLESTREDGYKIGDKYYNQKVYKLINSVKNDVNDVE